MDPRRGAGPSPAAGRIRRMVPPYPAPQAKQFALNVVVFPRGFCRANCSTRVRTWSGTGGRPRAFG